MAKDVIISISGLQFETEENEAVEVISRGQYYFRNGKHFLTYEELSEEDREVSRCVLKISEHSTELTKKGSSNVHMVFEEEETNMTYYNTPFGELLIGITTQSIKLAHKEGQLDLEIRYLLDINYQHVSECRLHVCAKAIDSSSAPKNS